jgi:nucleoside-diphosphate-sugar epimerase
VPTFIAQALRGEPLTVHGDGSQTRSFCYIDDMVEGVWRLLGSDLLGPVNLGNPEESKILEVAELVRSMTGSASEIAFEERPVDDPEVRCPDIGLARTRLGWGPVVPLAEGLERTIAWARESWEGSPWPM